jgi:hypothetical protein
MTSPRGISIWRMLGVSGASVMLVLPWSIGFLKSTNVRRPAMSSSGTSGPSHVLATPRQQPTPQHESTGSANWKTSQLSSLQHAARHSSAVVAYTSRARPRQSFGRLAQPHGRGGGGDGGGGGISGGGEGGGPGGGGDGGSRGGTGGGGGLGGTGGEGGGERGGGRKGGGGEGGGLARTHEPSSRVASESKLRAVTDMHPYERKVHDPSSVSASLA